MELNFAARRLRAAPSRPVAPIADYIAWYAGRPAIGQGRQAITAQGYRRIATLRRTGSNWSQIAQEFGATYSGAGTAYKAAWERLPEALR